MSSNTKLRANPEVINMWATCTKCWMCRHRFGKPVILPVEKPGQGKLQPNYNAEVLVHLYDTHAINPETVVDWVFGSIYGLELSEVGFKKP